MIIKKAIILLVVGISLSSCFDETITARKITKDYYLHWIYEKNDQILLKSSDEGISGIVEISETVFAIGFNDKYIIAKQHPNLEREISERLFDNYVKNGDYLLENPADTIYLAKDDSIYKQDGKWYHISNGWNPPDSLKDYKKTDLVSKTKLPAVSVIFTLLLVIKPVIVILFASSSK